MPARAGIPFLRTGVHCALARLPGCVPLAGSPLIELLIVVAIVGILASFGMAVYRHARVRGGEVGAIAALTAINQAQFAFAQACGNQRYAPTPRPSLSTHPGRSDTRK